MLSPKRVPLRGVRYIAAGAAHTVAVTDEATYSWGAGGGVCQEFDQGLTKGFSRFLPGFERMFDQGLT